MHISADRQQLASPSNVRSFTEASLTLAEPVEDVSRPARGIIVACCNSLVMWGAALSLLF
jgi:hypothetical protein